MADLGEWDETDYKFKLREYTNKITKEEIAINRWQLEIDEIHLKIENYQLLIEKAMENKHQIQKQVNWLKEKLGEKYGD